MLFFQKLCPTPFPPVSCSFPEPCPGPQCCLYTILEGQPENSWPLGGKYCIILALQAVWAQTLTTLLLKLQAYSQIKSPLHFYGTSSLLPLINLFLSHFITPTTRTLPPCRQHCSTQPVIKLMPLTGPDNPLLCHYFCYYLKWVYDNEMFPFGNTLSCSYGRLGEEINDLHSLRAIRR